MLGCHDYDGGEAIPYDTTYVKNMQKLEIPIGWEMRLLSLEILK